MGKIKVNHKVNLGFGLNVLCLAGSIFLFTRAVVELSDCGERLKKNKKHEEMVEKNREVIEKAGKNMDVVAEFLEKLKIKPVEEEKNEVEDGVKDDFLD